MLASTGRQLGILIGKTLIPVLLPVPLPVFVPIQNLTQSQMVATKTPNPLISLFWRRSLSFLTSEVVVSSGALQNCNAAVRPGSASPIRIRAASCVYKCGVFQFSR